MEVPSILRGTKFVTERATVAARFDMLCLDMLPQSCLVAGRPKTILALPQVSQLAHLLGNRSLKFNIHWTVNTNCYIGLTVYFHDGLTCPCDIYFCGDARHSWMGKTLNRLDSCSPDSAHVSPQCVPKVEFCTWLSTCSLCTARDHQPCTSLQLFQPQDLHK